MFHINHTIIISLCGNKPSKFHVEKWVVPFDYQVPIESIKFKLDARIGLFYVSTSNMEAIMHLLMLCPFKSNVVQLFSRFKDRHSTLMPLKVWNFQCENHILYATFGILTNWRCHNSSNWHGAKVWHHNVFQIGPLFMCHYDPQERLNTKLHNLT